MLTREWLAKTRFAVNQDGPSAANESQGNRMGHAHRWGWLRWVESKQDPFFENLLSNLRARNIVGELAPIRYDVNSFRKSRTALGRFSRDYNEINEVNEIKGQLKKEETSRLNIILPIVVHDRAWNAFVIEIKGKIIIIKNRRRRRSSKLSSIPLRAT